MENNPANSVPNGVRAIAALFALCGIYLAIAGAIMLLIPGTIAMSAGAPLVFGLELSGPYMFLLAALVAAAITVGLLQLNNSEPDAATSLVIAGVAVIVPSVSAATVMAQPTPLIRGGLG